MIRTWTDRELDDLLLALMEHPQIAYYLRNHGLSGKKQQIIEKRLRQTEKNLKGKK